MKNELENIDESFINSLDKKGGFKTSVDYFENSTKDILSLINISSTVSSHKPEAGFKVPENYFEQNKKSILSKIKSTETKVIPFYSNWKFVTGIAALLIATITLLFILNNSNKSLEASLNKVSSDEMVEYLATNDIKTEWLNENNILTKIENKSKEEQTNKELEQYLIEHADEQFLLEEL